MENAEDSQNIQKPDRLLDLGQGSAFLVLQWDVQCAGTPDTD